MVIHNFLSIIHDNVCVVYLIVLLTIKSNFQKILKDVNSISPTTGCVHLRVKYSPSDQLVLYSRVVGARRYLEIMNQYIYCR